MNAFVRQMVRIDQQLERQEMSDHYIIKLEPSFEVTPLLNKDGTITRQGDNVLYELGKYGYSAKIEKVE